MNSAGLVQAPLAGLGAVLPIGARHLSENGEFGVQKVGGSPHFTLLN